MTVVKILSDFPKPRPSLVKALIRQFGEKDHLLQKGKLGLAALMLDAWNTDRNDYVSGWIFPVHRQYFLISWDRISAGLNNEGECFTPDQIKVMTVSELLGESEEAVQSFLNSLANELPQRLQVAAWTSQGNVLRQTNRSQI